MASLASIVEYLDSELRTADVPDYAGAMNGLQLANSGTVEHVASAVDFSTVVVREAIQRKADLLIVHHGMFWNGPAPITGPVYERLSMLLANDVAVYASHIPLDLHPTHGNNVLLARELGLEVTGGFATMRGVAVGVSGESAATIATVIERARAFCGRHGHTLVTTPIVDGQKVGRWGMCSGAGASADTLREAVAMGLDTLIVGEGPHHTAVQATDLGLTILYLGHYATETLGVRSIGETLAAKFGVQASFIDAPTGL